MGSASACSSAMRARMPLNSGRGISSFSKACTSGGAFSRRSRETPMAIFAGSERVPMGLGFFGSIRVSQAFWSKGGSSS
ncbi:hypothetical protein D3C76_1664060 [compost metagenome]